MITSTRCYAALFRGARGSGLLRFVTKDQLRVSLKQLKSHSACRRQWADEQPPQPLSFLLTLCSVSRLLLLGSSKAGHLHSCCLCEGHGREDNECFHQQCRCDHHCEGEPVESSPHHTHQGKLNPGPPCQHQQGRVLDYTV